MVTNLQTTSDKPGDKCLKYLWKPFLTARDAKIVLLTSAERRSVNAPGEC